MYFMWSPSSGAPWRALAPVGAATPILDILHQDLFSPGSVSDVGTGPGRVPLAIARDAPQLGIDGIDRSPAMVAAAQRAGTAAGLADRVTFEVAELPCPDAGLDLVISSLSLHHWSDPHAALRELRRVFAPAGQVWIYDAGPAVRRGVAAAHATFPGSAVRVEAGRTGRLPFAVAGRLLLHQPA
jgi:ubiquinone/menaquinone biosynthesis C-methylase UbiE